ncbi:MAG: beta-ketoacyl-ACP synthase III [bacterium]
MPYTRIAGTGRYLPDRVVTNHDLEALMDTSDEWIRERSGISERRFAAEGQGSAELGVGAARDALEDAGWTPEDVEFIVFATLSPDMYFPGDGVLLQRGLGMEGIGALDVRNQCTGFIYALSAADAYIRMGMYRRVLLVGSEVHSTGMSLSNEGRDTAVLFGDGAGAVCLEATEEDGSRIMGHRLHADGRFAEALCMRAPSSAANPWISKEMIDLGLTIPHMEGREVFRHAVTRFPEVIREVLEAEGLVPDDVSMVVPHQANQRITEAMRKRLGLPPKKVYSNIHRYGNTTAASIPIALDETVEEGLVDRGDLVCLAAFGSGFTWGATLLRF